MNESQQAPGWYPDPEQAQTQRYWDGENWTEQRAPLEKETPPDERTFFTANRVRRILAGLAVLVAVLYFTGKLDHALYPLGLNFHECGKNGYGSVYCGDDLEEYKRRVVSPLERELNSLPGRNEPGREFEEEFNP